VFGFAAFVFFLAVMFGSYLFAYRRADLLGRMVILGIVFGFLAMLIHQMSEFVLTLDPNLFTWPILMCVATSSMIYRDREKEELPASADSPRGLQLAEQSA
jgi:hypothetical protein